MAIAWDSVKGWIVGLTGVLVVVPALINGGIDVYRTALKVPRTETERANVALFKKYFNKAPVASLPVPIKHNGAQYQAVLAVYDEGDVFMQYGDQGQWFPFPDDTGKKHPVTATISLNLISAAFAQESSMTSNTHRDQFEGEYLIRTITLPDGTHKVIKINSRTGQTDSPSTVSYGYSPVTPSLPIATIDLDATKVSIPTGEQH